MFNPCGFVDCYINPDVIPCANHHRWKISQRETDNHIVAPSDKSPTTL